LNTSDSVCIVVVDDEPEIREEVCEALGFGGFHGVGVGTVDEFWRLAQNQAIGLVIVDLMLPGSSGNDLAREIRAVSDVGIVIVTGRGDVTDAIVALELGADDFIQKPVHARELLARVKAVLRRSGVGHRIQPDSVGDMDDEQQVASPAVTFLEWEFDLGARTLTAPSGSEVELTTAEYDLLRLFVERPRITRTRDWLLDQLHGPQWVGYDRGVDGLVSRLRRKLMMADQRCASLFKSVRGVGYMFTATVTRK
jgi:two-component system, OmpR family, response regulator